ncbi:SAP domain-containing ribonucleoprotein isoform X1 [Heterodontus francisci]|uniref:SAP domain-containing ribonucleoprotein isoform X1 n=1 Tax=Heterodontus francisci TaxID=7792 RepID=UPI00355C1FDC
MADRMAVDISKLKLTELRQECASRELDTKGNKQDLIQRLQAYLEEHAEEEVNEEDVLAEDTEEEEQQQQQQKVEPEVEGQTVAVKEPEETTAKKLVKIMAPMTESERLKKRAERFNVPGTAESKKAARAARFGLPVATKGTPGNIKTMISAEKLRERAERFGMNVSSLSKKTEDDEKMKKRKERFGIVTSSAGGGDDVEVTKLAYYPTPWKPANSDL